MLRDISPKRPGNFKSLYPKCTSNDQQSAQQTLLILIFTTDRYPHTTKIRCWNDMEPTLIGDKEVGHETALLVTCLMCNRI